MENWDVRRVTPEDAARVRALRLEMLADSPLAFLETLAQAAARPHESYRQRIRQSSAGFDTAQFIADPGGPLVGHAGGTTVPGEPGCTVIFAVYLTPACRAANCSPSSSRRSPGSSRSSPRAARRRGSSS